MAAKLKNFWGYYANKDLKFLKNKIIQQQHFKCLCCQRSFHGSTCNFVIHSKYLDFKVHSICEL